MEWPSEDGRRQRLSPKSRPILFWNPAHVRLCRTSDHAFRRILSDNTPTSSRRLALKSQKFARHQATLHPKTPFAFSADHTANSKTLGLRAKSLDRRGLSDFPGPPPFRPSHATFSGGATSRELSRPMRLAGRECGSQVNECPPTPPVHGNFDVGLALPCDVGIRTWETYRLLCFVYIISYSV